MSRIVESKFILPLVLLVLGLVSRFAFIWHPREVVFDEVHFGKFVSGYLTGNYFFDIHPPLGKLLISLAAYVGGFRPGFDFNVIGASYADSSYIVLRFVPNLFGALIPVCVFFFARFVGGSKLAAFFAGTILVFENAILIQSHFILVDSMLIFFGFLGLALFFLYRNRSNKLLHLFLAGIFLSFAVSVKWTGVSFLGLVMFVSLWDAGEKLVGKAFPLREIAIRGVMLVLIPFFIYMSIFAVHFALLDKSGPGDAFMSAGFLKTLEGTSVGDSREEPLNFIEKFIELNQRMYSANATLSATHSYSSKFYTWPAMIRPVYYWVKDTPPNLTSRIYLLGNPFVWWIASAAMIAALIFWKSRPPETKWFLYLGWYLNFFPFFNIKRVMFLYHYLPALVFSVIIMSLFLFDGIEYAGRTRYRTILFISLLILFIAGFAFFMPLSYGLPLSPDQYNLRGWLDKWQ